MLLVGITDGTQVHNITSSSPYPCAVCFKRYTELDKTQTRVRQENGHYLHYLSKFHFEYHSPI